MIDPTTGMPVDENSVPRSLPGVYGTNVGQNIGIEMPVYYDLMSSIPPASTTVAWNMNRVKNTILNNNAAKRGRSIGGIRQTFSPFRFLSLDDVGNIDPAFRPNGPGTPRIMASRIGRVSRRGSTLPAHPVRGRPPSRISSRVSGRVSRVGDSLATRVLGPKHGPLPPPTRLPLTRPPLTGAPTGLPAPVGRMRPDRPGYTR